MTRHATPGARAAPSGRRSRGSRPAPAFRGHVVRVVGRELARTAV